MFVSRDAGRFTIFGGLNYQRVVADGVFALFQKRRRDHYAEFQIGTTARLFEIRGFVPSIRLAVSRNSSTVALYEFKRSRLEFSLGRQF